MSTARRTNENDVGRRAARLPSSKASTSTTHRIPGAVNSVKRKSLEPARSPQAKGKPSDYLADSKLPPKSQRPALTSLTNGTPQQARKLQPKPLDAKPSRQPSSLASSRKTPAKPILAKSHVRKATIPTTSKRKLLVYTPGERNAEVEEVEYMPPKAVELPCEPPTIIGAASEDADLDAVPLARLDPQFSLDELPGVSERPKFSRLDSPDRSPPAVRPIQVDDPPELDDFQFEL